MIALAALLALAAPGDAFHVVVLGAEGGLEDGDLSAYWIDGDAPVVLDAGTLVHGMKIAQQRGTLRASARVDDVAAFLISHPHFDHVAGLAIGSAADGWTKRPIVAGLPSTIDALRDHVFNNVTWANFGSEGSPPVLARFRYLRLAVDEWQSAGDVTFAAYPLSHGGITSTAFVVQKKSGAAIVYCGDTGPDLVEHSDDLARLFTHIAGLVRGKKLAALFLESSWPSARDDKLLFGHLTPKHLLAALHALAEAVDVAHPKTALSGLNVVVTHIKPALDGTKPRETIEAELARGNDLGVRFLFPQQGDALDLAPPR